MLLWTSINKVSIKRNWFNLWCFNIREYSNTPSKLCDLLKTFLEIKYDKESEGKIFYNTQMFNSFTFKLIYLNTVVSYALLVSATFFISVSASAYFTSRSAASSETVFSFWVFSVPFCAWQISVWSDSESPSRCRTSSERIDFIIGIC